MTRRISLPRCIMGSLYQKHCG